MIIHTPLDSLQVVKNDLMCVTKEFRQFRFPKHKSHRKVKKWAKNKERNWKVMDVYSAILIADKLYVSTKVYKLMEKSIQKSPDQRPGD